MTGIINCHVPIDVPCTHVPIIYTHGIYVIIPYVYVSKYELPINVRQKCDLIPNCLFFSFGMGYFTSLDDRHDFTRLRKNVDYIFVAVGSEFTSNQF